MSTSDTTGTNLALLGVLSGVIMTALYAEGAFEYWDMMPGLFVLTMLCAYWNQVGSGFFVDLSMSIMAGAGLLMIAGVFVEHRLVGIEPSGLARTVLELQTLASDTAEWRTFRNNWLTLVWAVFSGVALLIRLVVRRAKP